MKDLYWLMKFESPKEAEYKGKSSLTKPRIGIQE